MYEVRLQEYLMQLMLLDQLREKTFLTARWIAILEVVSCDSVATLKLLVGADCRNARTVDTNRIVHIPQDIWVL